MTKKQKRGVRSLLLELNGTHFHHGDCVGSDEQAHVIALGLNYRIIIHPPVDERKRAFCKGATLVCEQKPYLVRNKDIVRKSVVMLATPRSFKEYLRSGTWSTVRHSVTCKVRTLIIWPDGRIEERTENPDLSTLDYSE